MEQFDEAKGFGILTVHIAIYNYDNKDRYEGGWKNDKRNGKG